MITSKSYKKNQTVFWFKTLFIVIALSISVVLLWFLLKTKPVVDYFAFARIYDDYIANLLDEQRIGAPEYKTKLSDGTLVLAKAVRVIPDQTDKNVFQLSQVDVEFKDPNNEEFLALKARDGIFYQDKKSISLENDVFVHGFAHQLKSDTLDIHLMSGEAESIGHVHINSDDHSVLLTAGQMYIYKNAAKGNSYRVLFKNGVSVTYNLKGLVY